MDDNYPFNGCSLVSYHDDIPKQNWVLPCLYHYDLNDRVLIWQIGFVKPNIMTYYGLQKGKKQVSSYEVKINMSGRDLYEQAWVEGCHKYYDQVVKKLYRETLEQGNYRYEAMTGHPLDINKTKLIYPVAIQPKIDGIRMIAYYHQGELIIATRNNKQLSSYVREHFKQDLENLLMYLPTGVALDGEIFNPYIQRNELGSIVSTYKTKHPNISSLRYYVFDIINSDLTSERYTKLLEAYMKYQSKTNANIIELVPSCQIDNGDDLMVAFEYYTKECNMEGIVIRHLAEAKPTDEKHLRKCYYRSGKSNNILKLKAFFDSEYIIVDIREGKGKFRGQPIFVCQTPSGKCFNVVMIGNTEARKRLYQERHLYIGKMLKVKYYNMVGDIPQMPIGLEIRNYEI